MQAEAVAALMSAVVAAALTSRVAALTLRAEVLTSRAEAFAVVDSAGVASDLELGPA
jgi:hypothetical protein